MNIDHDSVMTGNKIDHRTYFVDEAGDGVLFSERGKDVIATPGCSRYYGLGIADVIQPDMLAQDMEKLRAALITDPYFKDVPSMQPKFKKTAVVFHAKDDLPEVRKQVFGLLLRHEVRFFAVIRDKRYVAEYVKSRNMIDMGYKYNENDLYDYLIRRLFKDRLHKESSHTIVFAKRGNSDRTEALRKALESAKLHFQRQWGKTSESQTTVACDRPERHAGLQAVDYFMWALQRAYERKEGRFIELLWPKVSLVQDIDDTRKAPYGAYYTRKKPLTTTALRE